MASIKKEATKRSRKYFNSQIAQILNIRNFKTAGCYRLVLLLVIISCPFVHFSRIQDISALLSNSQLCRQQSFSGVRNNPKWGQSDKDFPNLFLLYHLLGRSKNDFNKQKQISKLAACENKKSILYQYLFLSKPSCSTKFYSPDYRAAVKQFIEFNGYHVASKLSSLNNTLTVIVGNRAANEVLNSFSLLVGSYTHVIFVKHSETIPVTALKLMEEMKELTKSRRLDHTSIIGSVADIISLSSEAHNLFVYHGDISALAALACLGNVFYAKSFSRYMSNLEFRNSMHNAIALFQPVTNHPNAQLRALQIFKPQPSCCSFKYLGSRMARKIICENAIEFATDPCWILSIGCRGAFQFETAVIETTKCTVHVFDCTGSWKVPPHLHDRVKLHKICLGFYNDTRESYVSLRHLIEIGAKYEGDPSLRPTLLKLDADGYEYTGLSELVTSDPEYMPDQIALEIHMMYVHGHLNPYKPIVLPDGRASAAITDIEAREFLQNMSAAGYKLVNRIDDINCPVVCAEVLFVKVDKLP